MILRSRIVLPVARPPIENGAVRINGQRIVEVGPWAQLARAAGANVLDLGESILLPGLINAHCHLDYTDMAGTVPPQKTFTDWIPLMLSAKAEWAYSEFAASWLRGAGMLLRSGTTTVADIEAVPELLPEVWTATPLRVISLLEMTGVRSRRPAPTILHEAVSWIDRLPGGSSRAGLSPHAPYSTAPELLRLSAETATRRRWPLSIHVSESEQEFVMFMHARGPMYDWLQRNGRDVTDCGIGSPIQHLERNGALTSNLLAIHVNYLARRDAALLRKKGVSVVHCPRSHRYFDHAPFPFTRLDRAKVNLCLGTDSLATVYKRPKESVTLSLFEEMQTFARVHPRVPAERIVRMSTINGARALGQAGDIGEISRGALADLISIPFSGASTGVHQAVVQHRGEVAASMIAGQWAIPPKAKL